VAYLDLARMPHVLRLLSGAFVGRLPTAMAALAIALVLRAAGGSYGFVGFATGAYAIAAAVGSPLLGRLVDRIGQVRVLAPTAVLSAVGYALVALAPDNRAAVLVGAVLAGGITPPIEPCVRVLWPRIVPPDRLQSAYALDSAGQELIFVTGPLVVAACVALVSPKAALWVAAVLGVLGMLVVVTASPARRWRAPARSTDWLGPLRHAGLTVLLVGLSGMGFAIGTLNVLVVSYAEGHRLPGGAATLLTLNATGALLGVLSYGALRLRAPLPRRALTCAAGLTAAYALLALVPAPPLMAVLLVFTGVFLAPLLTITFGLIGELAPPGTTTEAFAWLITLFVLGSSLGSAVVGIVLEHANQHWAAAGGAFGAGAGLLVLAAAFRLLRTRQPAQLSTVEGAAR
jgi:MFS family permease